MGLTFTDFDKITDVLMFLSNDITLNICMTLNKKNNKDSNYQNFHSEFKYINKNTGATSYSIKRQIMPFFQITDLKDYKNSVMIRAQDIVMLKMLIDNNIMPWYIGSTRIYFFDENNKLQIKGKYQFQDINMSEYCFLAFAPIILRYDDGTEKEGVRMLLNSKERFVDMQIDTFLAFYYYITSTDLYAAGANMANYVKMNPYDIGLIDMDNGYENRFNQYDDWNSMKNNKGGNFFNKL